MRSFYDDIHVFFFFQRHSSKSFPSNVMAQHRCIILDSEDHNSSILLSSAIMPGSTGITTTDVEPCLGMAGSVRKFG
eukprot:g67061.t1